MGFVFCFKITSVIYFFLIFMSLLFLVAYYTLLERKVMAAVQLRNGPDFVGPFGALQPIADAIKLLFKNLAWIKSSNSIFFLISPILIFICSFLIWPFIPTNHFGSLISTPFSLLWVLVFSSLSAYALFLAGLSSSNKYALLGSLRAIAQLISYEIVFSFLILPVLIMANSFDLRVIVISQELAGVSNYSILMLNAWAVFICILAETNRAPFDLPEAEAELVAGYNVEYSSLAFAYFFLGEYLNMVTMGLLWILLFFSGWVFSFGNFFFWNLWWVESFFFSLKISTALIVFVWVRATLPRVRYDMLMRLCWKHLLFWSVGFFLFFISIYFMIFLMTN